MASSELSGALTITAVTYILYTDIYHSSRLTETYPQEYLSALERHNSVVETTATGLGGRIYHNTGDGYIIFFTTADNCLRCAISLQQSFATFPAIGGRDELLVRVIAHAGLIRQVGEHYFSPALNRASRICQACHPGQVLISAPVKQALRGQLGDAQLIDLGEHHLRDLTEPERLFQVSHPGFARVDFPPLPTLASKPNNLIMRPDAFIGRQRELAELTELLSSGSRLVTIIAPGGYGKSRIAEQLCAELLAQFERGVFFIELAPEPDCAGVAPALADALGFSFYGISDPQEQLIDYLREKEILLCFDNFEHLLNGAAFVATLLQAAPRAAVIVTSREALHLAGERLYPLNPLGLTAEHSPNLRGAEAVQLFETRAKLVNPDFKLTEDNLAQIAGICRSLEGIPLAIELAAAWTDSFSPAELAAELNQQLELTVRRADVPQRQSSLRASLDWGWKLMTAEQQLTLTRLAPFQGGFFAEGAAAVLDASGLETRSRLAGLIDKSWLITRDVNKRKRFFMRDAIIHAYVRQILQASRINDSAGTAPADICHAGYYSGLLAREGPKLAGHGQQEAMESLRLELPNILAALDTLAGRLANGSFADEAQQLLLPVACWAGEYLSIAGKYQEARERYEALAAVAGRNYPQIDYWTSLHLGRILLILRESDRAEMLLTRAKSLAEHSGDRHLAARPLSELGTLEYRRGNYSVARELLDSALALRRAHSDQIGAARTLGKLGVLEQSQGNLAAARELYAESLAIRQAIGDDSGAANSLSNLGTLERAQRNYTAARQLYDESLALVRALGDRHGIARALNNLAILEQATDNRAAARQWYAESLAIYREIGDRANCAVALGNLGILESAEGNADAARDAYRTALAIVRETGDLSSSARLLNNFGALEQDQGNLAVALHLYQQALGYFRELGDRENVAIALGNLAILEQAQGNLPAAREHCLESLRSWNRTGDEHGICECLAIAGSLLAAGTLNQAAALAIYGANYHARRLKLELQPMERQLLDQGLAALEHQDTGLAGTERERLQAQAEASSPAQLAEAAIDVLERSD